MRKIKKGDEVIVISGKDKGKRGAVSKVLPEFMIVVDGINVVKRHTKPNPQAGVAEVYYKEMPINQCKVNLYNPVTNKPDRIGIRSLEDGTK